MPGLLDIAPPEIVTEKFEIRGGDLEVRALRNREWAMLLRRFPGLQRQMEAGDVQLDIEQMDAITPAVIAAGLGKCGDEQTEVEIVERLTEAERSAVFSAIMRLTNGPPPLAGSPVEAGQDSAETATTSPRPSSS